MATGGFGSTGMTSDPTAALVEQKLRAEQIVKNGAGWFLAIAGLSILNSVLTMSGTSFHSFSGSGLLKSSMRSVGSRARPGRRSV